MRITARPFTRVTDADDYTARVEDEYIGITNTGAERTVTLPAAASCGVGKLFIIKDESGAAGTNNVVVDANSTELIDGAETKAIATNYGSLILFCTGSAWFSI